MTYRERYIKSICSCPAAGTYRPPSCTCADPPCAFCGEPLNSDATLVVHHIDENRNNNDLDNLVGMHNGCHRSHHTGGWSQGESERILNTLVPNGMVDQLFMIGAKREDFLRFVKDTVREAATLKDVPPSELTDDPRVIALLETFNRLNAP